MWNESKVGDIILGWGLEIATPSARNDREKNLAMMNKRSAMITKGAVK